MYGIFNVASKFSSTLAEKAALFSMDDQYIQDTTKGYNAEHGVTSNLLHGAKSLGMGFLLGLAGLITSPIKGASEEGLIGFLKGIGKGIIGIAAKPTHGVLQSVSSFTAGLRNIAGKEVNPFAIVDPLRFPRAFYVGNRFLDYRYEDAYVYHILKELQQKRFRFETYDWHCFTAFDSLLICTRGKMISVISPDKVPAKGSYIPECDRQWRLQWETDFSFFQRISASHSGNELYFYTSRFLGSSRGGALQALILSVSGLSEIERKQLIHKIQRAKTGEAYSNLSFYNPLAISDNLNGINVNSVESNFNFWIEQLRNEILHRDFHVSNRINSSNNGVLVTKMETEYSLFVQINSASGISGPQDVACEIKLSCITDDAANNKRLVTFFKTNYVKRNGSSATWNQSFQFSVGDVTNSVLDISVTGRGLFSDDIVGYICIPVSLMTCDVHEEMVHRLETNLTKDRNPLLKMSHELRNDGIYVR